MADERIKIPVEIDSSKGLAQLVKFSRDSSREIGSIGGKKNNNGEINIPVKIDAGSSVAGLRSFEAATGSATSGLNKLTPGAKEASFAISGFSRVIQDSPYGLIGIANNLQELPGYFRGLSVAAKESGQSITSLLGKSLTSVGGLTLGVSLVTSALTFAQVGFDAWTRGLGGSRKEIDATEQRMKKLKDAINGIYEGAAKEASDAAALIGVLKSENETRERKIKALKELKEIQPEIFNQLQLEGNAVAGLDAAYTKYLQNLQTVIAVRIKQAQIESKITELLKAQGQTLTASEKTFQNAIGNIQKTLKQPGGVGGDIDFKYAERLDQEQKEAKGKITTIQNDIKGLIDDIAELSKGVELKPDKSGKDPFDDIIRRAKELSEYFGKTGIRDIKFEVNPLESKQQTVANALRFIESVTSDIGRTRFRIKPEMILESRLNSRQALADLTKSLELVSFAGAIRPQIELTPFMKLNVSEQKSEAIKTYDEVRGEFENQFKGKSFRALIPVDLRLYLEEQEKRIAEFNKNLEAVKGIINQTIIDSLGGIGDSLGALLSGGDLKNVFTGFANIIASGLQALGKQFIQMGATAILAKNALKSLISNPYLAIAAGIALTAVGSALKNSIGNGIKGFAEGGLAFGPLIGMVGEGRGTNRSNPEVIAPLDKLKSFFGEMINERLDGRSGGRVATAPAFSMNMPSEVRLYASGTDLVGAISLENRRQGMAY